MLSISLANQHKMSQQIRVYKVNSSNGFDKTGQKEKQKEGRLTLRRLKGEQEAAILEGVNEQAAARTELQHGGCKELKTKRLLETLSVLLSTYY